MPTNLYIVYFDAASGHRTAAIAIKKALQAQSSHYKIKLVNLVDMLIHHPMYKKLVAFGIKDFNFWLKRDLMWDVKGKINLGILTNDLITAKGLKKIARFWHEHVPDAIISTLPIMNPVIYKSARLANPKVKCITYIPEIAECKRKYWFTPKVEQYYILPSQTLRNQGIKAGIPERYLINVKGVVANPEYYTAKVPNRDAMISKFKLNPNMPIGLMTLGGQGSLLHLKSAKHLNQAGFQGNMIFLCGRYQSVVDELNQLSTSFPKVALPYVDEVSDFWQLADYIISRPGTMTITEALIFNKPILVFKSKGMHPVQKFNEQWLESKKVGIVMKKPTDLSSAISQILADENYQNNAKAYYHQGVFQTADAIENIIES